LSVSSGFVRDRKKTVTKLIIIGCGGFIGALLRYGISGAIQSASKSISFPYGTLGVNVIGCLFIGLLAYLVETRSLIAPEIRMFLMVGLLGSLTTFSTFGNETFELMRDSAFILAALNIAAQVLIGLTAVWCGRAIACAVWG